MLPQTSFQVPVWAKGSRPPPGSSPQLSCPPQSKAVSPQSGLLPPPPAPWQTNVLHSAPPAPWQNQAASFAPAPAVSSASTPWNTTPTSSAAKAPAPWHKPAASVESAPAAPQASSPPEDIAAALRTQLLNRPELMLALGQAVKQMPNVAAAANALNAAQAASSTVTPKEVDRKSSEVGTPTEKREPAPVNVASTEDEHKLVSNDAPASAEGNGADADNEDADDDEELNQAMAKAVAEAEKAEQDENEGEDEKAESPQYDEDAGPDEQVLESNRAQLQQEDQGGPARGGGDEEGRTGAHQTQVAGFMDQRASLESTSTIGAAGDALIRQSVAGPVATQQRQDQEDDGPHPWRRARAVEAPLMAPPQAQASMTAQQPAPHASVQMSAVVVAQAHPQAEVKTRPVGAGMEEVAAVTVPSQTKQDLPRKRPAPATAVAVEGTLPQHYSYDIRPGDDLDVWQRNLRRRLEVEIGDGCSVQIVQEVHEALPAAARPHGAFPTAAGCAFSYAFGLGCDIEASFASFQRRLEAELGEGATIEVVAAA